MKIDHITLQAEKFTLESSIEFATICYEDGRFVVNIEGEENDDIDIDDEDDPFYSVGPPVVNFHWESDASSLHELEGTTVKIDEAYDEALGSHVATLFLSAHYDLNHLVVMFRDVTESKVIAVITGSTDPDATDVEIKVLAHVALELTSG